MSITEAPDMTVASSSPWRCCGRQQKTSLGETGDTKEEYDMERTQKKKEGDRGPTRNPSVEIWSGESVCVRERWCVCVGGDNQLLTLN